MAPKVEVNAQELLKQAVPVGHWRYIADGELPAAIDALKAVVGRESKSPSWQRRLAVTADGVRFLLVVDNCLWKHPSSIAGWNDADTAATQGIQTALPIEAAVALLNSAQSPERELARRRALAAKREADEAERQRIANAKAQAEARERQRVDQERTDYRADTWSKLNPLTQFGARLALAVEQRDPQLAADVRACADASPGDFPRGQWWVGLDRVMEAQRVTEIMERIPTETRVLLKIQHGPDPAAIVKGWELLQAQRKPKAA